MTIRPDLASRLPPMCHARHPTDGTIVLIRRGEMGFQPVETTLSAELLNALLEPVPTPRQIEAMLIGSMFGWDVPGADPDRPAHERGWS